MSVLLSNPASWRRLASPNNPCPRPLSPAPRLDSTRDTMKLKIVSRSGKDLVPGGLDVKDSVRARPPRANRRPIRG